MKTKTTDSICPKDKQEWREWLINNHESEGSIWLIIHKKSSKTPTINWSDAVDEALCFGWIDSTKRSIDGEKYTQYYSKRKTKSNWSKVNKDKIEQLTEQGLMFPAGLESIEIAKQNGSWTILDDVENLIIPEELEKEFIKYPKAKAYYLTLSNSIKKSVLYWVMSAKRPPIRAKRVKEIVECACEGRKPKHFG